MTQKDKNLFFEISLTFLLLITAGFLLKPAVFWRYQILLIGGSLAGFIFGWFTRKIVFEGIKYLMDAAILIAIAWIGYRIFKSTFLYKEVLAIFIQGVIILEIIYCFNFSAPGKIIYIQILSLLIFMTSAIFEHAQNIPLAIVYLLIWLAILRFQFAGFLHPFKGIGARRYYSIATSLVCFLMVVLLAWFIASNVYLGRIKKGMFLADEDQQDMGEGQGGRESDQADNFYSLQDNLQSKITGLALKFDSYEKRRQLIYLFSELVKDTLKTIEVDKAELGLIDILKRPGPGLEAAEQAMMLTKSYVDQKNSRNLGKSKEEIMDLLKKHPLSIIDKIKIISLASKIQQVNSYQQLQENSQALQAAIQGASLSRDDQKDLGTLARNLVNLKAFELYRRKVRNLEQGLSSVEEEMEKKITDIVSDIKHTEGLEDFKQTVKKIRQLKNDSRISGQKPGNDILKKLEEAARIKLDLISADKSEQIRQDVSQKQGSGSFTEEFDKKMDGVGQAKNHQELIKEFTGLSQQNRGNNLDQEDRLGEMLNLRSESFKQIERNKLDDLIDKRLSVEVKKELFEAFEAMEEKESSQEVGSQSEELVSKLRELEKKGNLSSENIIDLLKGVGDFKELLNAKLEAEAELKKDDLSDQGPRKSGYMDQLRKTIEESSLNSQKKERLQVLSEQLLKTQSLSQLEDVKKALEKEISFLKPQEVSDKDRKRMLAEVNNILADLKKKLNSLDNATVQQIKQLQEDLKKMQQSQDAQELDKASQELKQAIKSTTTPAALDKSEQSEMLQAVESLKDILNDLLGKKVPTANESREINKISEKIKQAVEIKQQFLMSEVLADISEKIEKLNWQDPKKYQALKEKLEQMRKSNTSEEAEKIILDLKNISNSKSAQEDNSGMLGQEGKQQWKIYILSSPLIISQGVTMPLKVIAVYKNGYIKELRSDVEWFSTEPQVAWVDDFNFLHSLTKGKTNIKVVYKEAASKDTEVNVVEDIDIQTVRTIKQEIRQ